MTTVNQQLIADQLGISRTTVSRCFTNHRGINPITRAKVFDLASQLGYQHMEMRTAPRVGRNGRKKVAVLICTELEEYFRPDYQSPGTELYAGISEYAQLHNLRLSLHYVSPKEDDLDAPSYRKVDPLQNREADGVILIYPFPRRIVDAIHMTFPMVSLVEQYGTAAFNCVDADHFKGIGSLLNLLVERGHQRIGFYTKTYAVDAPWSRRRFSAYFEEMIRLGFGFSEQDVVNVYPERFIPLEESFCYVRERIEEGVTAWVCAADHQAYDLIAALQKQGVRVPEDVSITGFDGIEKPGQAPLLTTAVIPYREIGFTGLKRLTSLMGKRYGSAQHILVTPHIREGETIGSRSGAERCLMPASFRPAAGTTGILGCCRSDRHPHPPEPPACRRKGKTQQQHARECCRGLWHWRSARLHQGDKTIGIGPEREVRVTRGGRIRGAVVLDHVGADKIFHGGEDYHRW